MPKQVDHDERRREIIEALYRVAVRDGLAAATYRNIATEAGIRAAQVQYYFPAKRDLLEGALMELGRRVVGRGLDLIAAAGPDPSAEVMLRSAVAGALPSDDTRREEIVLFYLFFIEALSDDAVANSGILTSQRFIIESFASWIRVAQERGEVAANLDALHEARLVLWANTGLVLGALVGIHTVDDAAAAMDYLLTKLFTT